MFPMVLPLPRTSASFGAGVECFLAHAGSASMASGASLGAVPSKVTVPVTVEAAKARFGQTNIATRAVARHNVFPVQRIIGSLVIANPATWPPSTPSVRECADCTPPLPSVQQPHVRAPARRPGSDLDFLVFEKIEI